MAAPLAGSDEAFCEVPAPDLGQGRLLVWHRDLTIDDGVGESVTGGFLDESDTPPWDTWITYVDADDDPAAGASYLVSWVPLCFVATVDKAIRCNAYDALFWLRGTDLLVARTLGQVGLVA